MILAYNNSKDQNLFIVDKDIFPQTLAVLQTRAEPLGIVIQQMNLSDSISLFEFEKAFGLIVQLPNNKGRLKNPDALVRVADVYKCMKIAIVDPLAQVLMQPVGEMGFDIAVGLSLIHI